MANKFIVFSQSGSVDVDRTASAIATYIKDSATGLQTIPVDLNMEIAEAVVGEISNYVIAKFANMTGSMSGVAGVQFEVGTIPMSNAYQNFTNIDYSQFNEITTFLTRISGITKRTFRYINKNQIDFTHSALKGLFEKVIGQIQDSLWSELEKVVIDTISFSVPSDNVSEATAAITSTSFQNGTLPELVVQADNKVAEIEEIGINLNGQIKPINMVIRGFDKQNYVMFVSPKAANVLTKTLTYAIKGGNKPAETFKGGFEELGETANGVKLIKSKYLASTGINVLIMPIGKYSPLALGMAYSEANGGKPLTEGLVFSYTLDYGYWCGLIFPWYQALFAIVEPGSKANKAYLSTPSFAGTTVRPLARVQSSTGAAVTYTVNVQDLEGTVVSTLSFALADLKKEDLTTAATAQDVIDGTAYATGLASGLTANTNYVLRILSGTSVLDTLMFKTNSSASNAPAIAVVNSTNAPEVAATKTSTKK